MKKNPFQFKYISALLVLLAFASCKSGKNLTADDKLKPISTNRLIKNVEENAFQYESLDIKRIACVYETPDNKISFRATLTSERDSNIQVNISKMNLPVGRVLLTPDSVKMVNYLQRNYFLGDYSFMEKMLGAAVDFNTVQAIMANDVFAYRSDDMDFESYVDNGQYVLQSMKNRKLNKINRKGKDDKVDRYLNKIDEESFVVQYLWIDPNTFKVNKILIDDLSEDRKLTVDFSEFTEVENQLYPGSIDVLFESATSKLGLKVKLSRFSLDSDTSVDFKIPEKYKPLKR